MGYIKDGLFRSKIVKNILAMLVGASGAQLISMLAIPIISRLFTPSDIGMLGSFQSILAILTPIAGFSYPVAIVLANNRREAAGMVWISVMSGAIISLIIIIALGLVTLIDQFTPWNIQIETWLYFVPLFIFFITLNQISENILIKENFFGYISGSNFISSLVVNGTKIGFGLLSPTVWVLISATFLGILTKIVMQVKPVNENNLIFFLRPTSQIKPIILDLAKKYSDFPIYRMPESFLSAMVRNIPVIILASFLSSAAAGYYVMAKTVLAVPGFLLTKAVGDVFFPKFTDKVKKLDNPFDFLVKFTIALSLLSLLPYTIVMIAGPEIFTFVFGIEWADSGLYAQWISLWLFTAFSAAACTRAIAPLKLQKVYLMYRVFYLASTLVALFIGIYLFEDAVLAIAIYCIVSSVMNILLMVHVLYYTYGIERGKNAN